MESRAGKGLDEWLSVQGSASKAAELCLIASNFLKSFQTYFETGQRDLLINCLWGHGFPRG